MVSEGGNWMTSPFVLAAMEQALPLQAARLRADGTRWLSRVKTM